MYGNFFEQIARVWSGYPGGYKKEARGSQAVWSSPPFQQPEDAHDLRSKIPALGHREYWYPALPDTDVKWDRPQVLRMLGMDLVFFHGKDGAVKALLDACPHRGAYLSLGDCFYKGFVTCPYHGGTYDGDGNCVAMLTEGPDSKLPGEMRAWPFPTVTLKGLVFVWMGEGKPVDPREDIPPELFDEPHTVLRWSCQVMHCNWILVLENTSDAHNCFFVHRNCISVLRSRNGGRPRTPLGRRTKIIKDVIANTGDGAIAPTERYYFDEEGKNPLPDALPGCGWRLADPPLPPCSGAGSGIGAPTTGAIAPDAGATAGTQTTQAFTAACATPAARPRGEDDYDDWSGTRLPSISAKGTGGRVKYRSHRWAVPIERDMTRVCYINIERYQEAPSLKTRLYKGFTWPFRNWSHNFNFRYADLDAERSCQYSIPEYLSATDSRVVVTRKLLAEYGRGVHKPGELSDLETREDELIAQRNLDAVEAGQSVHLERIRDGLAKTGLQGFE